MMLQRMGYRLIQTVVCCLLTSPALATVPAAYAYAWPLELPPGSAAYRVVLTPEIYARIVDSGLRDLEVFNAAGQSLPFGPIPMPKEIPAEPVRETLPWFPLPDRQARAAVEQSLTLRIKRDAEGRLRALDAEVPDSEGTAERPGSVLVDLDPAPGAVEWLELEWEREGDVSARYQVAGSHDLVRWRTLRDDVGLVDLRQGGHVLRRNRIELPAHTERYLMLTRIDGGTALTITDVAAAARPLGPLGSQFLQWITLDGTAVPGEERVYRYRTPGPLPVAFANVELAHGNAVVDVQLTSRGNDRPDWHSRTRFTAFRVGEQGVDEVSNEAQLLGMSRDREWQLRLGAGLDQPPRLRLGYRPDEFALLARGDAPFTLVAGSATLQRPEYPIAVLLAELRARRGIEWQLADARLGSGETLAGDAAYAIVRDVPWRQWTLWGVLVIGALMVVGMVLRLTRG